jgi:hypothetical protein
MKKSSLALVTCICLFAYPAIAYAEKDVPAPITVTAKSKKQLAQEVLVELGIGKQYDLHIWNSVYIAVNRDVNKEFKVWLQQTIVRFAGWKYVESQYVTRLATNFSQEELEELLSLAKKPLMKKLLRAEIQAYEDTGEKRAGLLWQFWEDYNDGKVSIPPNFLN